MSKFEKSGHICKTAPRDGDMEKINALTLRELSEEEVFIFRVAASNDQPDRDCERFAVHALEQLAKLFVGKPIIMDHSWSAKNQTARIFDGCTEKNGDVTDLILSAYMVRSEAAAPTIAALEGGILKEVSIGCSVRKATCSICGTDKINHSCPHIPGREYDGETCYVILDEAGDAYELSFCAVPSNREAGVVKAYGGENNGADPKIGADIEQQKALAELELEEII